MSEITIRPVQGDEVIDLLYWLPSYAFLSSPPTPDEARVERFRKSLSHHIDSTFLVLFEDGKAMSCLINTPMTQNLRGQIYPMGGVWWVATHPAARRKGYTKRLMVDIYARMRAQGQVVSCLYPFRESFYCRLGYVTFPQEIFARFDPASLTPLLAKDLPGAVKFMPVEEGRDEFLAYLRKYQQKKHGIAINMSRIPLLRGAWLVLAQVNGETIGMMTYTIEGEMVNFTVKARRFYYDNSVAKYLLLKWFAQHIDQATTIQLKLARTETPEMWLPDIDVKVENASLVSNRQITAMGRVIDVTAIGGMRTGEGHFSARISDPHCPWNEGSYLFETVGGLLQVRPTVNTDCELTIQALSALVYGTHDPGDFAILGWGNPTPGIQAIMGPMFPRMTPYLHEEF